MDRVKIESCSLCHSKSFFVGYDELLDAEGWIECEFDGTMLKSADPAISNEIIEFLEKGGDIRSFLQMKTRNEEVRGER